MVFRLVSSTAKYYSIVLTAGHFQHFRRLLVPAEPLILSRCPLGTSERMPLFFSYNDNILGQIVRLTSSASCAEKHM